MKYHSLTLLLYFSILVFSCSQESGEPPSGIYAYDMVGLDQIPEGDQYVTYEENPFVNVDDQPISTFSIDADGASYANMRRFLTQDEMLPPKASIRTEEMINYFQLDYPFEPSEHPISLNGEISTCPWNEENKLIRIGIKGEPLPDNTLPPTNFVYLIDVSGSMSSNDKLDLLKRGFIRFTEELGSEDKISIVTYAGSAGVLLRGASGDQKSEITSAIESLGAGGSTAGAAGIATAYEIAQENFIEGGNNRIILGSDGDFNVGISSMEELIDLIEEKRQTGIYLTVLGVGRGNLHDGNMEQIANHGNGTYEYVDNIDQLMKVFIYESSKFFTVAKDVKVQVVFNPNQVQSYRLIGYENRLLNNEDFENDSTDAGEIGADQDITALYEIIPLTDLQLRSEPSFTIDFRYKRPNSDVSTPMSLDIFDEGRSFIEASEVHRFTASIAAYAMVISESMYKEDLDYDQIIEWLDEIELADPHGFKSEFKMLVGAARNTR